MNPPNKVKIANHQFFIEKKDKQWADDTGFRGRCHCDKINIEICMDYPSTLIHETLIHEITHAIYWAYNVEDGDAEERTVTQISIGLSQVWVDNPELIKYLNSLVE